MPATLKKNTEKAHKNEEDIVRGQRLKRLRSMASLTISSLAEKTGISRVSLNFWEKASRATLSEKGARRVIEAIKKENIDCSFEWLWEGRGEEPRFGKSINNNAHSPSSNLLFTSIEKEIELFCSTNKNAVITKINDAKLWPYFEFNDIVGGSWQPINTLRADSYCIISLNDALQVRWVKKNSDTITTSQVQISFSPALTEKSEIDEVKLDSVAPIIRLWR